MQVDIQVSRDSPNFTRWIAEVGPLTEEMRKKHGNPIYIGGGATSVEAAADALEWVWKNRHTIPGITRYPAMPKAKTSTE